MLWDQLFTNISILLTNCSNFKSLIYLFFCALSGFSLQAASTTVATATNESLTSLWDDSSILSRYDFDASDWHSVLFPFEEINRVYVSTTTTATTFTTSSTITDNGIYLLTILTIKAKHVL